jgi:hypothetical protein
MKANVEALPAESDVQHELDAKVWLQRIFAVAQLLAHVEMETDKDLENDDGKYEQQGGQLFYRDD